MAYNFPNERRTIERRAAPKAAYAGPERRLSERRATEVKLVRKREPMNRWLLWAALLMVLVVVDTEWLDGAYRHMVFDWINGMAASARSSADHVWDWGH